MLRTFVNSVAAAALVVSQSPTAAQACTKYIAPSMCDDVAHDKQFWIGEYSGEQLHFDMFVNGQRHVPAMQTRGKLTLFDMNGRLGFAGSGAFKGEAEMGPLHSGTEALQQRKGFEFLFERPTRDKLKLMTDDKNCTFEYWPRWAGTYKPPQSPTMNIELIGVSALNMLGHVSYEGSENGVRVQITSIFTLLRREADVTGWEAVTYADGSSACNQGCMFPGAHLDTGDVWADCPGK